MPSLNERMMSEYGLNSREARALITGYMVNHREEPAKMNWRAIKQDMDRMLPVLRDSISAVDARTDVFHEIFECGKDRQIDMMHELDSESVRFRVNNYADNITLWSHALMNASAHVTENTVLDSMDHYRDWVSSFRFGFPANPARTFEVLGLETKAVDLIISDGTRKDFQAYMTEKAPYLNPENGRIERERVTKLPNQLTNEIFDSLQKSAKEGTYEFFSRRETMNGYWKVLNCKDLSTEDKQMITSAMTQEIGKGYAMHRAEAAVSLFRSINALDCPEEQKADLKELAANSIGENWPERGQERFWESVNQLKEPTGAIKISPEKMETFLEMPWQERGKYSERIWQEEYDQLKESATKAVEEIRDGIVKLVNEKAVSEESIHAVIKEAMEKNSGEIENGRICYSNGNLTLNFESKIDDYSHSSEDIRANCLGEILAASGAYTGEISCWFNETEKMIAEVSKNNEFMKEAFLGRDAEAAQALADRICSGHGEWQPDEWRRSLECDRLPEILATAAIASNKDAIRSGYDDGMEKMSGERMAASLAREIHYAGQQKGYGPMTNEDWEKILSGGATIDPGKNMVFVRNTLSEDALVVSEVYRCINSANFSQEEKAHLKEMVLQDSLNADASSRYTIDRAALTYAEKARDSVMPGNYQRFVAFLENGHDYEAAWERDHKDIAILSQFCMNVDPHAIMDAAMEKYAKDHPELPQPTAAEYRNSGYSTRDGWVTTRDLIFRFEDKSATTLSYYNGSIKDGRTECGEAMRTAVMSSITELSWAKDRGTLEMYQQAKSLAETIEYEYKKGGGQSWSLIEESFTKINENGHMELSIIPWSSCDTEVRIDMETKEVWAEKDGEVLSAFDRIMEYRQADSAYTLASDILSREEDRGQEMERDEREEEQEEYAYTAS